MPKPSILLALLLILAIVVVGVYLIAKGALREPVTAATTPGAGTTSVSAAARLTATRPAGAQATPRPATGATPVSATTGDIQLASNEVLYQVRQGDTLWAISRTYNTTVEAIARRNNIPNPHLIYVGQVLIVPKGVAPTPTPIGQIVYVVEWGDTLWEIARRYGTTVDAIAAVNHISNPNLIYVGQWLVIPLPAVG